MENQDKEDQIGYEAFYFALVVGLALLVGLLGFQYLPSNYGMLRLGPAVLVIIGLMISLRTNIPDRMGAVIEKHKWMVYGIMGVLALVMVQFLIVYNEYTSSHIH